MTDATTEIQQERENVDTGFNMVFRKAEAMAEKIGETPTQPRSVSRQINRGIIPACTVEEYYRKNLGIPFLDHVLENMKSRFPGE